MTASTATKTATAAQRLVFDGKQQVRCEAFNPEAPKPGHVRLRSEYTLMSTGTENIVFNRQFDAGTSWDLWVNYPFYPGYAMVGIVDAIGDGVTEFTPGQRVTTRYPHATHQCAPIDHVVAVPDGVDPKLATWFSLAKIAYSGCRAAEHHVGDNALIIGAGPIGQMALRWAFASGVRHLVVVDPIAARLRLAEAGGASATIACSIDQAMEPVKAAFGGKLPRVVIDTTGNAAVFAAATRLAANRGRVVILGDTGSPASQHLTSDVIVRGLSIVGAHDTHWPINPSEITGAFFDLALTGRFRLDGLNTHIFKPNQCEQAYELANTRRGESMGILFDWT